MSFPDSATASVGTKLIVAGTLWEASPRGRVAECPAESDDRRRSSGPGADRKTTSATTSAPVMGFFLVRTSDI